MEILHSEWSPQFQMKYQSSTQSPIQRLNPKCPHFWPPKEVSPGETPGPNVRTKCEPAKKELLTRGRLCPPVPRSYRSDIHSEDAISTCQTLACASKKICTQVQTPWNVHWGYEGCRNVLQHFLLWGLLNRAPKWLRSRRTYSLTSAISQWIGMIPYGLQTLSHMAMCDKVWQRVFP